MKSYHSLFILFILFSCNKDSQSHQAETSTRYVWQSYDDSLDLANTQDLENSRMHLKLINARDFDKNDIWDDVNVAMSTLSRKRISEISPLIIEQDIPIIQQHVKDGNFSYEELTLFYLNRIAQFESNNSLALNAVVSINERAVEQARELDKKDKTSIDIYSVYGMPVLLKDNIGFEGLPTTAGTLALKENMSGNAYIADKLQEGNAIILGKANLSEWAYFLCSGCPVGYSAVGGQTINPYGRLKFESGGSSSGSGAGVAANYAVAAIGTETSGSILSPSAQNSIVGLKPTIGLLSRSGIVPISSHLDTPGPMTKSVVDNAIVLQALLGKDETDAYSFTMNPNYISAINNTDLSDVKIAVNSAYLTDSLYTQAVTRIKNTNANVKTVDMDRPALDGFLSILNRDMHRDLKTYLKTEASENIKVSSIEDMITYNNADSLKRIPYGQQLFKGIIADTTTEGELTTIKKNLMKVSQRYFDQALLDAWNEKMGVILSINNYDAGFAAVAHYPAITIPMGYQSSGEPENLTLIAPSKNEETLYRVAAALEKIVSSRELPKGYE